MPKPPDPVQTLAEAMRTRGVWHRKFAREYATEWNVPEAEVDAAAKEAHDQIVSEVCSADQARRVVGVALSEAIAASRAAGAYRDVTQACDSYARFMGLNAATKSEVQVTGGVGADLTAKGRAAMAADIAASLARLAKEQDPDG